MTTEPARTDETAGWQRLDPRMLLVYPVKELVRFLPVLLGLFVAGTAAGGSDDWWHLLGVAVPVTLGVLRYFTTYFRIAGDRVELRRGVLNRHLLSTPLDRVRTVDITASPIHRVLGLATIRIGTGTASTDDDDRLDLDGLPMERARWLRAELLAAGHTGTDPTEDAPTEETTETVLRFDPSWLRFAPFTSAGPVAAAGVLGVAAQGVNTVGGLGPVDLDQLVEDAAAWSVWVAVPLGLVGLALVVSALSIAGYVVTNWDFTLTRTRTDRGAAWHLRRGLLTTRETTLDEHRVRGVTVGEPLGLRIVRGARTSAIVTGLGREQSGSSVLVPPAPRKVAERVAGEVLGTQAPLVAQLTGHGPRARARRFTRALAPVTVLLVVALALVVLTDVSAWVIVPAVAALPAAAALAADRARALGHALVHGHVVSRTGSIDRRREVLEVDGVVGWTFRSTWFQQRAGLTSLVAATAGGRQAVAIPDVPEQAALALARTAMPDLVDQFVAAPAVTAGTADYARRRLAGAATARPRSRLQYPCAPCSPRCSWPTGVRSRSGPSVRRTSSVPAPWPSSPTRTGGPSTG